jgi:hypothetical protein
VAFYPLRGLSLLAAKRPDRKRHSPRPGEPKRDRGKSAGPKPTDARHSGSSLRLRRTAEGDAWELVHPRCARDRQEDLEEVRKMIDAGEIDVAMDECRWLLQGCGDCLEAHRLLAEIALGEKDYPLARGHFGYAFRLGAQALERAGVSGPLPYRVPANQAFLESAKGLAWCLRELDKPDMAAEVVATALACDPSDPLGIARLMSEPPPPAEP